MSHPVYEIVSYARTKVGVRAWNRSGNTTEWRSVRLGPVRTSEGFAVDTDEGIVEFRCSPGLAKDAVRDLAGSFLAAPAGWVDKGVRRLRRKRSAEEMHRLCIEALKLWGADLGVNWGIACRAVGIDRGTLKHHAGWTGVVAAACVAAEAARAKLSARAPLPAAPLERAGREALALNASGTTISMACRKAATKHGVGEEAVRGWITRNGHTPRLHAQVPASHARRQGVKGVVS